jgi:hypothetical protein
MNEHGLRAHIHINLPSGVPPAINGLSSSIWRFVLEKLFRRGRDLSAFGIALSQK